MPFCFVGSSSHFFFPCHHLGEGGAYREKGWLSWAGRNSEAGAAPSLEGRDHNPGSPIKASTHWERDGQRRETPHGRAQLQLWPVLVQPSQFPAERGGQNPDLQICSRLKAQRMSCKSQTSLDPSLLIYEIVFRFLVSESFPALTFHTPLLFLKSHRGKKKNPTMYGSLIQ